jgi:cell division septation protein DedD
MEDEERDITIGPGKLLGLFFMLVVICGVFFAIGYSLGKTSAREQALNDKSPLNASITAPIVGDPSTPKPSAASQGKSESETAASDQKGDSPTSPDLTFFNAVKRDDRNSAKEVKAAEPTTNAKVEPPSTSAPKAEAPGPAQSASGGKQITKADAGSAVTPAASGSFVVQIAAVTREEDAAALAGALRKKNYSVFVVNNPAVHDKFYHVQVGPFATLQDAESMKAKLTGEGYNPIVKRS